MTETAFSTYSLDRLIDTYGLCKSEAERILGAVGPGRADIEAFMAVYRNRKQAESWFMNTVGAR